MKVPGFVLRYVLAATLGVATLVVLGGGWLPAWLIAGAFAGAFIVLLPRAPRLVAAFCAGAAIMMVAWSFSWSLGWSCASEVHGVLVEHDCGDPPLKESDR